MKYKGKALKQRIEYLDSLKCVCMFLVVFCHGVVLPKESIIGNFFMSLAWAAVPCFMLVSGALMHNTSSFSFRNFFIKLFKLYTVLCAWRFIYYIAYYLLADLSFSVIEILKYVFLKWYH